MAALHLVRLGRTLQWRGGAIILLAAAALFWADSVFMTSFLVVAAIAALFGVHEILVALSLRRHLRVWWLVLSDGGLLLAFGMLSLATAQLDARAGLWLLAVWFMAHAGLAIAAAFALRGRPAARLACLAWASAHVALAMLALSYPVYPVVTVLTLVVLGAVYAAVYGLAQLAVGAWLERAAAGTPVLIHE